LKSSTALASTVKLNFLTATSISLQLALKTSVRINQRLQIIRPKFPAPTAATISISDQAISALSSWKLVLETTCNNFCSFKEIVPFPRNFSDYKKQQT
jgi:hypothetical protein